MELKEIKFNDLPDNAEIIYLLNSIRDYLFPNYYVKVDSKAELLEKCKRLFNDCVSSKEDEINDFFSSLDGIYKSLLTDIEMTFDSDPAANSYEEIVIAYPGISAIITYRIAHKLYLMGHKVVARIMSEHAHSRTGIDIHPGATIGDYFFIDHGTGIVVGETTLIGHHVKLYQGVTLGALSLSKGQRLKETKRHPTIGNYVTLYSNCSILGGETIIGNNVTIGGNAFITSSIADNMKVRIGDPELVFMDSDKDF